MFVTTATTQVNLDHRFEVNDEESAIIIPDVAVK